MIGRGSEARPTSDSTSGVGDLGKPVWIPTTTRFNLHTVFKAARALGREVKLELV